MKRTFLFATIASVLATGAYATSATVTSRDYVDAQDALKQNKIPVTGTNSATPGDTVVTYTSTAGTIGERGIYDGSNGYNSRTDANKLVTAAALQIPTTTVTKKSCYQYQDGDCILWILSEQAVLGGCATDSQCVSYCDRLGIEWYDASCINGGCFCNTGEQMIGD